MVGQLKMIILRRKRDISLMSLVLPEEYKYNGRVKCEKKKKRPKNKQTNKQTKNHQRNHKSSAVQAKDYSC